MPISETWLLPDGIADVLPEQAQLIESVRQRALAFLGQRGYQLIYTPFIEYLESLSALHTLHQDLDVVTFKLIDQLSGRLLGVRADMTPQVARIDAHVVPVNGVARYCYAGTILHTKPQGLSASRTPLQLGAELFGHAGVDADLEMLDLMLGVLQVAGYEQGLHLDLGHVGLFRSLVSYAGLSDEQEQQLSDFYQRKAYPELAQFCEQIYCGEDFYRLGFYANDLHTLADQLSAGVMADPSFQQALQQLLSIRDTLLQRWPHLSVGVDAVELRSYHYHTGLIFAVYAPEHAMPLAQGGRYDGIGEHFGRARAATGFSCDLYRLLGQRTQPLQLIVAPAGQDHTLQTAIAALREQGRAVVQLLGNDELSAVPQATHQLVLLNDRWHVQSI